MIKNLLSIFNEIVKNTEFEDDFKTVWNDYSKEDKWGFVLACLSNYAIRSIDIILRKIRVKGIMAR